MRIIERAPGDMARLEQLIERKAHADRRVNADVPAVEREKRLGRRTERPLLARFTMAGVGPVRAGKEEDSQNDVLRRGRIRRTAGRAEDVMRAHHEAVSLGLRLNRERQVHGHLVAVEVGVEALADERVNLDGVAFD